MAFDSALICLSTLGAWIACVSAQSEEMNVAADAAGPFGERCGSALVPFACGDTLAGNKGINEMVCGFGTRCSEVRHNVHMVSAEERPLTDADTGSHRQIRAEADQDGAGNPSRRRGRVEQQRAELAPAEWPLMVRRAGSPPYAPMCRAIQSRAPRSCATMVSANPTPPPNERP